MLSQDELVDGLRDGLADRAAQVDAPDRLAESVRRAARRRAAGRTAGGVASLLAVGGIVAAAVTSGSTRSVPVRDAAYVARHVNARLAHAGRGVRLEIDTSNDPGTPNDRFWTYVDPRSHVEHDFGQFMDADGSARDLVWSTVTQQGRRVTMRELVVDPRHRTWSTLTTHSTASSHAKPSFYSDPTQIEQALKSGYFSLGGTTTIGGERALRIRLPRPPRRDHIPSGVLYVNARSYEPIAADTSFRDRRYTYRTRLSWQPATRSTIAKAVRRETVPVGYRKVPFVPPAASPRQRREYLRDQRQIERRRQAQHRH